VNSEAEAIALAREHLAQEGWLRVPVTSLSMAPMMRQGDWVWVEAVRRTLRVGDIVMVDAEGKAVIHRLIVKMRHYLILQGDAIFHYDTLVAPEHVVGIVIARERKGRKQDVKSFPLRLLSFLMVGMSIARSVIWRAWKGF
jgi:signal peptidase I